MSGVGVGKGYWKNSIETEKVFVANPFTKDEDHKTLYRTGDLGRRLLDGTVEFLGRIDHQVKIRGFRVECDEIEHYLTQVDNIKEAIVVTKQKADKTQELVAYYEGEKEIAPREIRKVLGEYLPEYMIPNFFMYVEKLPRTASESDQILLRIAKHYQEVASNTKNCLGARRKGGNVL